MKKLLPIFSLSFFIFIIGFFYFLNNNKKPIIYEEKYYKFGTIVSIKISELPDKPQKDIESIFNNVGVLINELHIKWHPWEQNSNNVLYNLNLALQNGKSYEVDKDTLNIIRTSKYIAELTDNLFNPINGRLYEIWGFHKEDFSKNKIPDKKLINEVISAKLTMNNIEINENIISTNIKNPKIRKLIKLDFNAIAKGQIILNIKKLLVDNGINNALINIGGDIHAMGYKDFNNKSKWTSAIFNPNDNNTPIKVINLKPNQSIATSGNYFRKFEKNNRNYHHIINSISGISQNKIKQVSIIHDNPLISDAIATAIMASNNYNKNDFKQLDYKYLVITNNKIYSNL